MDPEALTGLYQSLARLRYQPGGVLAAAMSRRVNQLLTWLRDRGGGTFKDEMAIEGSDGESQVPDIHRQQQQNALTPKGKGRGPSLGSNAVPIPSSGQVLLDPWQQKQPQQELLGVPVAGLPSGDPSSRGGGATPGERDAGSRVGGRVRGVIGVSLTLAQLEAIVRGSEQLLLLVSSKWKSALIERARDADRPLEPLGSSPGPPEI